MIHQQLFSISCSFNQYPSKVNEAHQPIMITRQNGKTVVVLSLEDWVNLSPNLQFLTPKRAQIHWYY
ncbi:type II toxin-antitoxin system Phd/YefM family antitoxin [Xenorhabdus sp. VLS]|uniref:Antitoxin n=1 Tax=Xenorhabdus lircayensis TaxID=2763499 RepID=A0ABS0U5I7_9GAMM|nr:type II toxin-antitoxin system Phd/YefM family antitoxin [Xenorhabdus lircayensis]